MPSLGQQLRCTTVSVRGCGGVGELQRGGAESNGVGGGLYSIRAGPWWRWCTAALGHAIGGLGSGAMTVRAVRASRG